MGSRSGAEIRAALAKGEPVTWRFTPNQKRLRLRLPDHFGGALHDVVIEGGYTFLRF